MVARLLIAIVLAVSTPAAFANDFLVLCYHDVRERYNGDPMGVSTPNFVTQLAWLRAQGYKAVTMDDVIAAKEGLHKLPPKAFLISVDDGYRSFYTQVFPILKLYGYHAVLGIVGKWIEDPSEAKKTSDDKYFRKEEFVTWDELKEMQDSGLVEIASHSYDLHHGIIANPQNNVEPAAVTLRYEPAARRYESRHQLRLRVRRDLQRNSDLIQQHLGKRPRIMVWPYGAYNQIGLEEAARAGMPFTFALNDQLAHIGDLQTTNRVLISKEPPLDTFSYTIGYIEKAGYATSDADPRRGVVVNLDDVYDPDPEKQNERLGNLLDQVQRLGVNTIYLRPYVVPKAGEPVREVYFPNRVLPMRGDIANRVSWQLQSRLDVSVYALMPIGGFVRGPALAAPESERLFTDLGAHVPVSGIVFEGMHMDAGKGRAELPAQIAVTRKLQDCVRKFQPREDRYYTGLVLTHIDIADWSRLRPILDRNFDFVLLDVNSDTLLHALRSREETLPRTTILTMSLRGDKTRSALGLLRRVQALERFGLRHFALADDPAALSPAATDAITRALSTRSNPYQLSP